MHPHFVTIHCANSLPLAARARIAEQHASLRGIQPNSPQFLIIQRQYFLMAEKFLDRTEGFRPFLQDAICPLLLEAWNEWPASFGWRVEHFAIMPNHVHFLMQPDRPAPEKLRKVLSQFKGRTARLANAMLARSGAFWQADWFDRWMRSKAETVKVIEYIRQNPVKAGLVRHWQEYRWVQ